MARPPPQRTISCYLCRHRFTVAASAMTTSCPSCHKQLMVEDIVVKTIHAVRKLQTCGKIVVQKKARVVAQLVEAAEGVEVQGILEGNVVSGGHVIIGAKAEWKGDCKAPSLEVELGAKIASGYFHIEPSLGAAAPAPPAPIGDKGGEPRAGSEIEHTPSA